MFIKSPNEAALDREIEFQLKELQTVRDDPEKYASVVARIAQLQKLKSEKRFQPPSLDTVLVVGANIFGILWLARYESEGNLIRSRTALNFVMRPRPTA